MSDTSAKRRSMVDNQLRARGIQDDRVLSAMQRVPREAFVPPALAEFAYDDTPLPLQAGQTISQPYIVALMAEAAGLRRSDRVLEIGTGSGYAAAVLAELVDRIDTVERLDALALQACTALQAQGYGGVRVHTGDGTMGWPQSAPFDAILAAAAGPEVPESWREQLAVGGRIIMPVGDEHGHQRLVRIVRTSHEIFQEEDLGAVSFVPLVGDQGWPKGVPQEHDDPPSPAAFKRKASRSNRGAVIGVPAAGRSFPGELTDAIWEAAEALPDPDDSRFGTLFDRFADKRVVMLGEASHGTAEFYRARAAITRRLVEAHGFDIIAVEADWPDAAVLDRYVRHRPWAGGAEPAFQRFPTWMWRNTEVAAFIEWLHAYNGVLGKDERAGFYGLDLYSLSASMAAVLAYLDRTDPQAAHIARERYGCLTPWQKDPAVYARAIASQGYRHCEEGVLQQLQDLMEKRLEYAVQDGASFLDAAQNARLVAAAERYYRTLYQGPAQSWNLRDSHMFETLEHMLQAKGPQARAVVWAHNSHIGDASATEMGRVRDEINIGQLCRQRFGNDAALIGFGTHAGTVAAADDWDGPMRPMRVRPSRPDSYEHLMHMTGQPRFLLDLRAGVHNALREALRRPRLERYIGVIYRPDTELYSHYAESVLSEQYDAFVWFDETTAVTPLPTEVKTDAMPETYPFAV